MTGSPCRVYNSCETCASDPFCGWCSSTGVCTETQGSQPLFARCSVLFISDGGMCGSQASAFQGAGERVASLFPVNNEAISVQLTTVVAGES